MNIRSPVSTVALLGSLAITVSALGNPSAAQTNEPAATNPAEGALTLQRSPWARFFMIFDASHGVGQPRSVRAQDLYDRTLSDSFTLHEARRGGPAGERKAERPALALSTTAESTASSAPAVEPAAVGFSPLVVAPTAVSTPIATLDVWPVGGSGAFNPVSHFAADLLTTPARHHLSDEAAAEWLANIDGSTPASDWNRPLVEAGRPVAAAVSAKALLSPAAAPAGQAAAYGWGSNGSGQLGNGSTATRVTSPTPVNSPMDTNATLVATGSTFSLGVAGGTLYAWGSNSSGQLGNGSTTNSSTPVAVSSVNGGFTNTSVTAIAAGQSHGLAIQNGTLYAWGNNAYGQFGNGTTNSSSTPTPSLLPGTGTVTAIAAGATHSLAIQGGILYASGNNFYGQLGNRTSGSSSNPTPSAVSNANGFTNTGVTAVAAGTNHSLAVQNGAAYAWGYNGYGQLGNGTTTDSSVPVAVLNLSTGVTAVAGGGSFSLALTGGGNVYAWGQGSYGQLGNNSTGNSSTPLEIMVNNVALSNIIAIAAGQNSSYALANDGSLYVWGQNNNGQLGIGNTSNQLTPYHLLPPDGEYYESVGASGNGTFALAILGSTSAVPEPSTWAGGVLTLFAIVWTLRRRLDVARA